MTRRTLDMPITFKDPSMTNTMKQTAELVAARLLGRAAAVGALALALLAPASANAQASTMTSQCVGGFIGCSQVNFTFAVPAGSSTELDFFRLTITGGTWRFTTSQAGSTFDAFGTNLFTSAVTGAGTVLTGTFALAPAEVDPFVRVLAQFQPNGNTNTSSLFYSYEAGSGGQTVYRGIGVAAVTATPEPSAMLLVASGLMGLGGVVSRRGRRVRTA
jgi:hypothetical protein